MENLNKEINWLLKDKYQGKATEEFTKDVERLKAGEPLDYVIGFSEFLGCKIDLSKKPLIPRTETEFWVQEAITAIYPDSRGRGNQGILVLDMFAGCGCIGISIMQHIKNAQVVFVEKDKNLADQIAINSTLNGIDEKNYTIVQSDIFSNVKGTYDYIFANPPYIPTAQKSAIQKSVLDYEPHQALFGGSDGLLYIKKFLAGAKDFLKPTGKIYLEFDSIQKPQIEKLLKKLHYKTWEFKKDQYDKFRYVIAE